jgi:hypothetical protein
MKLDNTDINVGSPVYDLAFGNGIVKSITLGLGFNVEFSSGYVMGYNAHGVGQFPNKTLFVRRPEVFTPFNDTRDILFGRVVRAIYETFKG